MGKADAGVECLGRVSVTAGFNSCPDVVAAASPSNIARADHATLTTLLMDRDRDTLTTTWSAMPDGKFVKEQGEVAFYVCESAGSKRLTVHVEDPPGCSDEALLDIVCE